MLKQPRLKYCYHAEFLDDERILLTSEKESIFLAGKTYNLLLSALQGEGLSLDELVAKLDNRLSVFEIVYALEVLEKKGYITESAPALPSETCAYWNNLDIEPGSLFEVFREKAVEIETVGPITGEVFRQALGALGIKIDTKAHLKVIFTDDYRRRELHRFNREALRTGQPWLLVKPLGSVPWLGPLFLPGKTACWECLQQRLTINRPLDTFYKTQKNSEDYLPIPAAYTPSSLQIAGHLAALEIARWLYWGKNERLESKVVTVDTQTLTTQVHLLVKRPQCNTCGNPPEKKRQPGPVVPGKKSSSCGSTAGGYREVSPEETFEKYQHHISPITGVVRSVTPYFREKNTPVYNYSSGPNTALQSKTLYWLNSHMRSTNGGKGMTASQAKTGALCEAIERYCLTYQGDEPYITASLKELKSEGIHPNTCMNFSENQYRHREALNRSCPKFYAFVPVPFDESLQMHWTPIYSLTGQTFKYLPTGFCFTQYPAENENLLFSYPDSNGSAAGNSIEEAILQGFLELVERDSAALWWYNRLKKPAVDLSGFNEPYFLQLIEYYHSLNRDLYILDLTADFQIPAFTAISYCWDGKQDKKENIVFGFGAHVEAKIAIERALVELNQLLPIAGGPGTNRAKGQYLTRDQTFIDWLNQATRENQPYLVPLEHTPMKKADDYPLLCKRNIYESLAFCLEQASKLGLEVLVLDLTRQDIGLPVVRVVVPGMRHFWRRLAPGRLYDVPVKMGWLDKPLDENEINPLGLFI